VVTTSVAKHKPTEQVLHIQFNLICQMAGMPMLYYLSVVCMRLWNDERRITNDHLEDREINGKITLTCILDYPHVGRAIAQAVSRRVPTAATRVLIQIRSFGICGGQSGTGAGFL
jgi:hypothetical protein